MQTKNLKWDSIKTPIQNLRLVQSWQNSYVASSEYLLVQKISFVHINTCHPSAFQSKLFLHGLITTLLSLLRKILYGKVELDGIIFLKLDLLFQLFKGEGFFLYLARERDSKLDLQLEMNVDGIILDLDTLESIGGHKIYTG